MLAQLAKNEEMVILREKPVLHRNITELVDGARRECWWCVRILTHLQTECKALPSALQGLPSDVTLQSGFERTFPFRSSVDFYRYQDANYQWGIKCDIFDDERLCEFPFFVGETLPSDAVLKYPYAMADDTNSQETWDYITDRLDNCKTNHTCTLREQSSPYLPTRLIKIRLGDDGKMHFRLVLTSNGGACDRYITLSHRWGTDRPLKLTRERIGKFQDDIPQHEMPPKYIDAAIAASKLEIQYMWIDSLCIIQDCPDDWGRESGTMDKVYQRAYCNLAATSSMDYSEGLFYKRSLSNVSPHKICLPESGNIVVVSQDTDLSSFYELDREPLYYRGWVCQERLLSTRNISFGRRLVCFECAEEFSCEIRGDAERSWKPLLTYPKSINNINNLPAESAKKLWYRIIEFYSRTEVTEPNDRLVAISGVVRHCQLALGPEYLAGLWKSNLELDLCWTSERGNGRVPNYRAPSWSWASMEGAVSFSGRGCSIKCRRLVDFVDTYVTLAIEANPYGAVLDARIRLIGWVFPMFHKGCESCESQERKQARIDIFYHDITELVNGLVFLDDFGSPGPGRPIDLNELGSMDCYLLPVVYSSRDEYIYTPSMNCLILVAVTPSRGVYRRVGMMDLMIDREEWEASMFSPKKDEWNMEKIIEHMLPFLARKYQHCKVPSYEGHTLEKHEIILV